MKVLSIVCIAISVLQTQGASSLRGRKLAKDISTKAKCGSIITVSTKLDTDLICPCTSFPALTLQKDEVTLDLGLHTVTCSDGGSKEVISISGKANVVRNGSVKNEGLGHGILLKGGDHEVSHVEVGPIAHGDGISIVSDRTIINRNTIISTGVGTGRGIHVKSSDANIIDDNTITKAGYHGILLEQSNDSRIQNNIVQESEANGVFISSESERNVIQGNFINKSAWSGLVILGANIKNAIVASNTVTNNGPGGGGITIGAGVAGTIVTDNNAAGNAGDDMSSVSNEVTVLSGNTFGTCTILGIDCPSY